MRGLFRDQQSNRNPPIGEKGFPFVSNSSTLRAISKDAVGNLPEIIIHLAVLDLREEWPSIWAKLETWLQHTSKGKRGRRGFIWINGYFLRYLWIPKPCARALPVFYVNYISTNLIWKMGRTWITCLEAHWKTRKQQASCIQMNLAKFLFANWTCMLVRSPFLI